ncbi:MAG: hypothetical protein V4502_07330 [Pseudomonadota bacterium]
MPNLSVEGPVLIVLSNPNLAIEDPSELPLSMLIAREAAERAAAKKSGSIAARRIHQELAQLYAARRRTRGVGQ